MRDGQPPMTRPVFFLHVSSAGGSSVCKWVMDQPCAKVPFCGANCNLNCHHPWDWSRWCPTGVCQKPAKACRPAHREGCEGLQRYVRRRNLTFIASETLISAGGSFCFDEFAHITVLRDPVDRLQSQLTRMYGGKPNSRLRALASQKLLFNTSERTSLMGTAALDNYLTRLLLGPSAFFLPLGAINASHERAAMGVLSKFALAVPIENVTTSGAEWLRASFGWMGPFPRTNRHTRFSRSHRDHGRRLAHSGRALGERSLRLLRALNRHDTRLVQKARERFERQYRELASTRFTPQQGNHAESKARPSCARRQCPQGRINWQPGLDAV